MIWNLIAKPLFGRAIHGIAAVGLMGYALFNAARPPAPDPQPPWFEHQDKLMHIFAYGVVTVLLGQALRRPDSRARPAAWGAFLLANAVGVGAEVIQGAQGAGRVADFWDGAANLVGAALASMLFVHAVSVKSERRR